jgi:methylamine dehydrogenase accessory protein MauD
MLASLIVSQILSWLVIIGLVVALLALARQVGVLHIRVAPAGALATSGGPSVGGTIGAIAARTLDGQPISIGGHAHGVPLRLLMFVSAQCPLCKAVIPMATSFARAERVALTFIGDDDAGAQRAMIAQHRLDAHLFINGPEVGQAYEVAKLPFAVLLDQDGTILSKGLVNSREHLESLVIAHEMGIATVQDYIGGLKAHAA